ncbi:uncharacterized protein [Cardiocondyla obscurior]|uniref:uncharacterized protein n=1 Tax=Cardiocondyla obscurior TaxID=286306 RepID=UPI0039655E83
MNVDVRIEIGEEIEIEVGEEIDEVHPLSEDSACETDNDDDETIENTTRKTITLRNLTAINLRTKFCAIYFYYGDGRGYNVCASCLVLMRNDFNDSVFKIRKHVVGSYESLNGTWCLNCRAATFVVISCDMCPSVVAALYPVKQHVDRESSYPHYATVLNVEGVQFPATLKDVAKLKRLYDISINVYVTKTRGKEINVLPIRLSNEKKKRHVNLLYVQRDNNDDNDNQEVGHFAYISNLSRLVSSQLSGREHRKHICDRCLYYFSSSEKLEAHVMNCGILNDCAIRLPSKDDKWLSFSNHGNKERVPFIVYADLECMLRKIETPSSTEQTTFNYQHHEVFSVEYYVRCSYDESLSRYEYRREPDCVQWFVERLVRLAHRVKNVISNVVPMKTLSNVQLEVHENATLCHEIATAYEGKINLLPITKEKYISFTKHVNDTAEIQDSRTAMKLRFIDSYKFLKASLDKLLSLLAKDKLRILRAEFATLSEENFNLLTRKSETVWQQFSIRTLGEYSDLYLKTDVLLLADVFENFRDRCVESYGLDPAHYYTLPGFTWDAMLKHTRINFELLTDIDMPLPYADFEWVNDQELANLDVDAIAVDSHTGYILEVDLKYPASVHDMHSDLPFCPTREKPPGMYQMYYRLR